MKSLIVVGTPAGGAGKSTLSLLLAEAMLAHGARIAVVDADIAPEGDAKVRLGAVLEGRSGVDVATIGAGPSDADLRANKNAAIKHWSMVRMLAGEYEATILDLGANVLQRFGEYMLSAAELFESDGIAITLLVPVTARAGCIEKAIEGLKLWAEAAPAAAVVIVQNELVGSPAALPAYSKLRALVPEATELLMPACDGLGTPAWTRLEAAHISPLVAESTKLPELTKRLNAVGSGAPLLSEEVGMLRLDLMRWRKNMAIAGFDAMVAGVLGKNAVSPASAA